MANITKLPQWQILNQHAQRLANTNLNQLFAQDGRRFDDYQVQMPHVLLDYSKSLIDRAALQTLLELAEQVDLAGKRQAMFIGERINNTEQRAVLHTALRRPVELPLTFDGRNIMADIHQVQQQMERLSQAIRQQTWLGYDGRPIRTIVNIGIGGSDLGPVMAYEALHPYHHSELRCLFVSNVDGSQLGQVLRQVDAGQTLFVVASKTFTTQETMANASQAKAWLLAQGCPQAAIGQHFIALSTNHAAVQAFGIPTEQMVAFWDYVGGRYSLWSAIGLSLQIAIGTEHFRQLCAGAYAMDQHFQQAPLAQNGPVLLALLGLWYRNFLHLPCYAILPYLQALHRLPAYLQQADMESNGKSTCKDGSPAPVATGPILFGEPGTNAQHAFFQLLHQGTTVIPADFIMAANSEAPLGEQHRLLMTNCLAQTAALMRGKTEQEALDELLAAGMAPAQAAVLAPHKVFPGNRPSNTLVLKQLTPASLGALLAMYEHKIFTQGVLWDVNSFDQWGVELGKQLTTAILPVWQDKPSQVSLDSSTKGLLSYLKQQQLQTKQY